MRHVAQAHQGTLLVQGKRSYTGYPSKVGQFVVGHVL